MRIVKGFSKVLFVGLVFVGTLIANLIGAIICAVTQG